jgi:hypothetical protein
MKAAMISALAWGTVLTAAADTRPNLAALVADDDPAHEIRALVPFIASLPLTGTPTAVQQTEESYGPGRESLLEALAGRWVEVDPEAALAYARHDEFRDIPGDIYDAYFSAWSRRDLTGALAALAHLPQGQERATAAYSLATFLASRDPAQAHTLIESVHTTRLQEIDYPVYWNWARQDLTAATQTLLHDSGYGQNRPGVDLTWHIVDSLYDQNPPVAAKWIGTLPEGSLRDTASDRLADVAGRRDPTAAVTLLQTLPTSDHVKDTIRNLSSGEQYSPKGAPVPINSDPAFAAKAAEFASIREEPFVWRRDQRLIAFVDGLAPAYFPLALEHLRRAPPFDCEDELDVLVAKWTEVDLPGAIAAIPQARGFYDEIFATRVMTDLFAGWSRRDPEAAFAYARQMPQGYGHCDVLQTTLRALAHKNPTAAYAAFRALNDPNSHILVTPIFSEWAEDDLPAATAALAHEAHFQGAIEGIIQSRLRHGLPEAAQWARHLKNPTFRDKALADVALRAEDTEKTMAWLEKEPAFPSKHSALDDIAVDWANRNSLSALRHAAHLPEGPERSSLMMWALMAYTYDDAPMAAGWCEQLPDGENKKHCLCTVFANWAESDPQSAAQYLSGKPADATASVLETVAGSWSQYDPPRTARWLTEFATKESKAPAIAKIAQEWYRGDRELATQWVNQLPAGASYDAGAKGICDALYGELPSALKWARSIRDPKVRHDAVYNAFALGTAPMRGKYGSSPGIKDDIQNETQLTDVDKKALLARLPVFQVFRVPQTSSKPTLGPNQ